MGYTYCVDGLDICYMHSHATHAILRNRKQVDTHVSNEECTLLQLLWQPQRSRTPKNLDWPEWGHCHMKGVLFLRAGANPVNLMSASCCLLGSVSLHHNVHKEPSESFPQRFIRWHYARISSQARTCIRLHIQPLMQAREEMKPSINEETFM